MRYSSKSLINHCISLFSVSSRCPSCQQLISLDKIVDAKNLEKEIQMLEVYCTNKEKGCDWMGTLRDFQVHVELCEFLSIDCPNGCDAKFEKRFLSKHQNEDCSKRTILCEFCTIIDFITKQMIHFVVSLR